MTDRQAKWIAIKCAHRMTWPRPQTMVNWGPPASWREYNQPAVPGRAGCISFFAITTELTQADAIEAFRKAGEIIAAAHERARRHD